MKIKIGIVGGAGYTGGELIRLLLHHSNTQIKWIHSNSHANQPIYSVHKDLLGDCDLLFVDKIDKEIDLLFLCSGHGNTAPFLEQYDFRSTATKIIALSQDFRLAAANHDFVYGLPELHKDSIKTAQCVANPGCFATAIQLALLPLASENQLENSVHISGIIGTTGAGQRPRFSTNFSWVDNNVSIFKPFVHQHLVEIKQGLAILQNNGLPELNFIPIRGNFSRGIFVTAYTTYDGREEEAIKLYQGYYKNHPFVVVSEQIIDLKQVINTNKCVLQIQVHEGKLLITSIIDNLIKGASGQAIQNMNLMFGLSERTGLHLKGSAF
jgi:N-acetyl-gamma-glutamyl-phosphate reductase